MASDFCKWGHPTRLRADRDQSGFCRECKKAVNRAAYLKRKEIDAQGRAAIQVIRQLEAALFQGDTAEVSNG